MKGGGVGGSDTQTSTFTLCPRPPGCCAPRGTAAVRCPRNRDAQRHQYVGAWEGVAPVRRCVRQTAARKGKEGKGAFRPKAYWLSSRGGPARRHLSTLSAWGGVRCLPVRHRCTERRVSVRNAFADGVWTFESRNGPNGVRKRRCRVSRSSAARARLCAPSPSSCLAIFVEIAGGNRARCCSTIDLVVVINHTGRFARVFAHACAYTTARPHDRTTARPHDRTTARPHGRTTARPHDDHELSRHFGRLSGRFSLK